MFASYHPGAFWLHRDARRHTLFIRLNFLSLPCLHRIFVPLTPARTFCGKLANDNIFFSFKKKKKAEQRGMSGVFEIVVFLIPLESKATDWFIFHFQALILFLWLPQNHNKRRKSAESKAKSNIFVAQAGWVEGKRTTPWIKWDTAK